MTQCKPIRPAFPSKQNTSIAHQSTNRQDFSNKASYTHTNPSRTTEDDDDDDDDDDDLDLELDLDLDLEDDDDDGGDDDDDVGGGGGGGGGDGDGDVFTDHDDGGGKDANERCEWSETVTSERVQQSQASHRPKESPGKKSLRVEDLVG